MVSSLCEGSNMHSSVVGHNSALVVAIKKSHIYSLSNRCPHTYHS